MRRAFGGLLMKPRSFFVGYCVVAMVVAAFAYFLTITG
jgi:hypothetical protein